MISIRNRGGAQRESMSKPASEPQLTVTDAARNKLLELGVGSERFMRIRVLPGGCSGMTYDAAIDQQLDDDDQLLYQDQEIRIVADRRSTFFIGGLHVDYSNDLVKSGFRLTNPAANKACGCGSSFAV
jgi:iron-sulfur cluster assembly protein